MEKEFTITSYAWAKASADNHKAAGVVYPTDDFILERLRSLAHFFESHSLTTHKLLDSKGEISENFVLKSTDLTELGMKVVRAGLENWMTNSLKRPPSDVSALERALKKVNSTS